MRKGVFTGNKAGAEQNDQQQVTALLESEQLLRSMLFKISCLSKVDEQPFENRLEAMRTSLKDGLPTLQLVPLFEEINRFIERDHQQQNAPDGNGPTAGVQYASEKLLEMMDSIRSPASLVEQIEPARAMLQIDADKKANNYFAIAMQAFFDTLNQFHRNLHDDNKQLEGFLHEMNGQLGEIKQTLLDDGNTQNAESKLEDSVNKISDELEHNVSGSDLTGSIRKYLSSIRSSVTEYKKLAQDRHQQSTSLIGRLRQRIESLEQETARLRARLTEKDRQYLTDSLTDIPNRIAYEERIQLECERATRNQSRVSLLVCDVDNFKFINDTYGHAAGDKVLKQIAKALQQNIRSIDFVARFGGEEFVIIMTGAGLADGINVADKLRKKIEMTHFIIKNVRIPVTFSGGVAEFCTNDTAASLFERADNALYIAKECGKNRIESE